MDMSITSVFLSWIPQLDQDDANTLLIWSIFGLFFTLLLFYLLLENYLNLRIIRDTPEVNIRSATQGYVALSGFARAYGEPLIAPLTQTPCVWYQYVIEEKSTGTQGTTLTTLDEGYSEHPFLMSDSTGACLVDLDPKKTNIKISLAKEKKWDTSIKPAIYQDSKTSANWFFPSYRLTERRIHSDDKIFLLGHFETSSSDAHDRQLQKPKIELNKSQSTRQEKKTEEHLSQKRPLPRIRSTGASNQPFIISTFDANKKEYISTMRSFNIIMTTIILIVGLASTLALVVALPNR